jgi:hypothetical protein
MALTIIAKRLTAAEEAELYFAIDESSPARPFILGGASVNPHLGASASSFGLSDIDRISGTRWKDWRGSMTDIGCAWVVPIVEDALVTGDLEVAVKCILSQRGRYPP